MSSLQDKIAEMGATLSTARNALAAAAQGMTTTSATDTEAFRELAIDKIAAQAQTERAASELAELELDAQLEASLSKRKARIAAQAQLQKAHASAAKRLGTTYASEVIAAAKALDNLLNRDRPQGVQAIITLQFSESWITREVANAASHQRSEAAVSAESREIEAEHRVRLHMSEAFKILTGSPLPFGIYHRNRYVRLELNEGDEPSALEIVRQHISFETAEDATRAEYLVLHGGFTFKTTEQEDFSDEH